MRESVDEYSDKASQYEKNTNMLRMAARVSKESALDTQIGGDHYKKQGMQPFEITFANFGYFGLRAAIYTKVNKYLKREKETHRVDIEKAIHCLQVQLEFLDKHEAEQLINQQES